MGRRVHDFDMTIHFHQATSTLIENLNSHQAYASMADHRFGEIEMSLNWFETWEKEVELIEGMTATDRSKLFISKKTMFDVSSSVIGFIQFCKYSFQHHPGCNVYAYRLNSNIVENVFCQQRGRTGQNENPTYLRDKHFFGPKCLF